MGLLNSATIRIFLRQYRPAMQQVHDTGQRVVETMEVKMLLRIIRGKLNPGTWDAFESAYRTAIRMLALSKVFVDAGWCKTSMIPIPARRLVCGRPKRRCEPTRVAPF